MSALACERPAAARWPWTALLAAVVACTGCAPESESRVGQFERSSQETYRAAAEPATTARPAYKVHVRRPAGPPRVTLAATDPLGRQAQVGCATCHGVREPDPANAAAQLDEFHHGLQFAHGELACYACHHPQQPDSLRLADGAALGYPDVMTLCAQCHSAQAAAFAVGAHGGMQGFWDLSRGPQTKHNCIDCHDPHAPQFPRMVVDFKPKDRFHPGVPSDDVHE